MRLTKSVNKFFLKIQKYFVSGRCSARWRATVTSSPVISIRTVFWTSYETLSYFWIKFSDFHFLLIYDAASPLLLVMIVSTFLYEIEIDMHCHSIFKKMKNKEKKRRVRKHRLDQILKTILSPQLLAFSSNSWRLEMFNLRNTLGPVPPKWGVPVPMILLLCPMLSTSSFGECES